jgi:tetratricopeptide (TPR) repeat protein
VADASPHPAASPAVAAASGLIEACIAELSRGPEPLRAARLHYEIARLYESTLGEPARAGEHYRKAHAQNPEHLPSLRGARRLLLEQNDARAALPLFDAEARLSPSPERRALVLYEKGRVLDDVLGLKREAREAFAAAADLDPRNATLLKAAERAARRAAAWDALDAAYEREADAVMTDPRMRAAIIAERARLVETKKGDPLAAADLYLSALQLDPRAPAASDALKRLHYEHQRWQDLVSVLERDSELATDPALRAIALYRVARIHADRLGKLDEAILAIERAAAEAPLDRMILEELARLYERARRFQDYAAVLERIVGLSNAPGERVGLRHRIGQLYEERLADAPSAIAWYARELQDDPTYRPALQALARLYAKRQQWEALVAMHLAEANASLEPLRRAAAHARIAELFETQLGNPADAAAHHARALGIVPGYAPSFKALVRLLSQSGKFRELVELYERAIEGSADRETKITFLFKVGRLQEDALGAASQAMTAYRRILQIDPNHLAAVHSLQRSSERAGAWRELIEALELEAALVKDKAQVLPLYHRAGEVAEQHLEDADAALAYYRRVIELEPAYLPALGSLGRLHYRLGRWDDLVDVYRRELKVMPKGAQAAALLYKVGELCESHLGNDGEAIASYRAAIKQDPFHLPSLHALGRKLSEVGEWQELVQLLELELSGMTDANARARVAFRAGEVYENRLGQPDKALASYEQAVQSAPDLQPALEGRARLLTHAKDWKRLVDDLEREANTSADPLAAVGAVFRRGEVFRDELDDVSGAVACFEAVMERDPAHLGALLALEPLYAERAAWEPLSRVYAAQARVTADPASRISALRELARLQRSLGVGSASDAKQTYYSILQLDPGDVIALSELERLALADGDTALLAHVDAKLASSNDLPSVTAAHQTRLAESLEASGDRAALGLYRAALAADPENLAAARGLSRLAEVSDDAGLLEEAAERETRVTRDVARAATLLVRSADLRAKRGDLMGASGVLEKALEVNPNDPEPARRLPTLLLPAGQVDRVIDALTRAAQGAHQPERRASLWGDVAELHAQAKSDLPAGLAALARVVAEQPTHVPTLMKLADFKMRDLQWNDAADCLHQVLSQSPPEPVTMDAHLRLAHVYAERLHDPARAVTHLEAVLRVDADNREALKRLLAVQMQRGQTIPAAETAARLVRVSPDQASRAEALCHLARLEVARGEAAQAIDAYAQALPLVGLGEISREFKEVLNNQKLLGTSRWQSYVDALIAYLEHNAPPAAQQPVVYLEMARVLDEQLRSPEKALQALQRGLQVAPADVELRGELALRLKRSGHLPQAADELRRLLELDVMRVDVWRELADVFKQLQRPDDATLAVAPIVAIGMGSDLERSALATRPSRALNVAPGSIDGTAMKMVEAVAQPDPAAELMAILAEGLSKIHPAELDRYGLSTRDRITPRTGHPTRALADRVAQVFGVADYDLYIHRAHSGAIEIEFTDPVAIMVPAYVPNLTEPQQVFLLGRVMANIARGLLPVDKYAPQALELLLAAAARNVDPSFGAGLTDDEFLSSEARRVSRILSRRGRRAMEESAQVYVGTPRLDFAEWALRTRIAAARAAAIVADDLPGSISLVRRLEADLSGAQGAALASGMRVVHDLLRFWVSDAAFSLRRRIGLQ